MPVSYCEIWENKNNNMRFHNKTSSEQALTSAINEFIQKREKGLHVCIICTDNSIFEQEQLKDIVIDLINKEANLIFLNEDTTEEDWKKSCFYACVKIVSSITELLNKMVTTFDVNLNKDIQFVSRWIELCLDDEQDSFEKPEIWCNHMNLRRLNNFLTEEERNGNCADIKFVFFLPQQCFEIFTAPNCLFNEFIECIILALSPQSVIQLNEELFRENDELKKENAELKKENAELKKENAELKKENTELKKEKTTYKKENEKLKRLILSKKIDNNTMTILNILGNQQLICPSESDMDKNQSYTDTSSNNIKTHRHLSSETDNFEQKQHNNSIPDFDER